MNVDTTLLPVRHTTETTIVREEEASRLRWIGLINTRIVGECLFLHELVSAITVSVMVC